MDLIKPWIMVNCVLLGAWAMHAPGLRARLSMLLGTLHAWVGPSLLLSGLVPLGLSFGSFHIDFVQVDRIKVFFFNMFVFGLH